MHAGSIARNQARKTVSRGFTLVELLVVIAIIGMLVGMLMPALGAARESARRSTCMNNASQIGKAFLTHDSEKTRLPGWRNTIDKYTDVTVASGSGNIARACVSWTVPILPFMDQNAMFDWYETYSGTSGVDDVSKKRIPSYVCPTAGTDRANESPLSYAVNIGTGGETLVDDAQPRGDGLFLDAVGNVSGSSLYVSGTGSQIYSAARTSLSQAASGDGASCTLMIAERCGINAPQDVSWAANPVPAAANQNAKKATHAFLHPLALTGTAAPSDNFRMINPTAESRPSVNPVPAGGDLDDWWKRYPSSQHRNGVVTVFADGHTRFLSEKIAPWVYCQMLTSDSKVLTDRAKNWQRYVKSPASETVPYIFDEADLSK